MYLDSIDQLLLSCRDCGAQPDYSNPPHSLVDVCIVEIESTTCPRDYLICVCPACAAFYQQSPDCDVTPLHSYTASDLVCLDDLNIDSRSAGLLEPGWRNSVNIRGLITRTIKERRLQQAIQTSPRAPRPARPRRPIPHGLRYSVLERDGFRCKTCGRTPEQHGVVLHVDHIVAVARGGTNDPGNLWWTHCQAQGSDQVSVWAPPSTLTKYMTCRRTDLD